MQGGIWGQAGGQQGLRGKERIWVAEDFRV